MQRSFLGITCLSILVFACCAAGCTPKGQKQASAGQPLPGTPKGTSVEAQIKAIQENPRMSPQAKQAALAGMRMALIQRGQQLPPALKQ
jgi:hypothetical protein